MTIRRSIIWDGTVVHDNCTIEDSLICDNVVIESNCVVEAGSRLDKNVHVKQGVVLASQTLASCRKVVNIAAPYPEFQPVTEVDENCFIKGAIIDEFPECMTLT